MTETLHQTTARTTSRTTSRTTARTTARTAARAAVVGAAAAAAIGVYAVTVPLLGLDVQVPASTGSDDTVPLAWGPVIFMAVAAALAGWALLAVLERFTRRARTVWTAVAVAVYLISLPYLPGFSATERIVLGLIHTALAAVLIVGLRRVAPSPPA
jgi:hypothetical protein